MSPRFLSDRQREDGQVFGLHTNAESRIIDGNANTQVILWDESGQASQVPITDELGVAGKEIEFRRNVGRTPILIRIQNLHASEPLRFSEDLRDGAGVPLCSAVAFTGVLPCGTATDDGTGGSAEWQKNRPSCITIHATNAFRCAVTIRYAE